MFITYVYYLCLLLMFITYVYYLSLLFMFITYVYYLCLLLMFFTNVYYLCLLFMFITYVYYLCLLLMFVIYVCYLCSLLCTYRRGPEECIHKCPAVNVLIYSYTAKDLANLFLNIRAVKITESSFGTRCCYVTAFRKHSLLLHGFC